LPTSNLFFLSKKFQKIDTMASATKQLDKLEKFMGDDISDDLIVQAAELFSLHYGIWGEWPKEPKEKGKKSENEEEETIEKKGTTILF